MAQPTILAVDLGTSGMKVALITVNGRAGLEVEPVRLILTPDGGAEQSPMSGGRHSCPPREGY